MIKRKGRAWNGIKPVRLPIKKKVFNLIEYRDIDGISTEELTKALKIKIHSLSARLAELEQDGKIYQAAKISKENEVYTVWKATPLNLIELRRAENWNKRFSLWIGKGLNNGFLTRSELKHIDRSLKLF
jgi:DNA-binding HxlR family transcriptional regulator